MLSLTNSALLTWLAVIMTVLIRSVESVPCFLCKDYKMLPKNRDCVLDKDTGETCFGLYMSLLMNEDRDVCQKNRQAYFSVCCDDDDSDLCYEGPTASPVYKGEEGDNPICQICGTDEYPGNEFHVFSTRYIGTYSCAEYYARGLHGLIPGYLCGPLQDYAVQACNCGQHSNPSSNNDNPNISDIPHQAVIDNDIVNDGSLVFLVIIVASMASLILYVVFRRKSQITQEETSEADASFPNSPDEIPHVGSNNPVV